MFGIGYFYTETELFTITSYAIEGVDADVARHIDTALREEATKKSFLIIPHNKILTYSKKGIISVVRDTVSDLATIRVHLSSLHRITIEITHLTPLFRVGERQAMTKDGIIFTPAYDVHTYPLLTIASSTEETIMIGGLPFTRFSVQDEVVDATFLLSIISISTQVSSLIFPVDSILVETTNDVTLSYASGTSNVFFLRNGDYKKTWSTLVSAIDTEPLKSKLATNKNGLLYLDVRYGNKVFYRFSDMSFQNKKGTAILGSHATTTEAITSATATHQ